MGTLVLKVIAFLLLAFIAVVMIVAAVELVSPRLDKLKDRYRRARDKPIRWR
jgi:large-conductance mechanosensitive channel